MSYEEGYDDGYKKGYEKAFQCVQATLLHLYDMERRDDTEVAVLIRHLQDEFQEMQSEERFI